MAKVNPTKLGKSLVACAAGALAVGVVYYLYYKIDAVLEPVEWDEVDRSLFISAIVASGTFAALAMIGLPVQAAMQRTGKVGILWHIVPGTLAGVVFFLLFLLTNAKTPLSLVVDFGLAGLIASAIAWLFRRPDKDALQTEVAK